MHKLFGIDIDKYPMTGNEDFMYWGEKSRGSIGRAFTKDEYLSRYRIFNHEIADSIVKCYGRPRNILSLGCGLGWDVERFVQLGIDVIGLEITKFAIENSPVGRHIIWGSAHDLSRFSNDEFELVISLELMEHLPPELTNQTISEIRRVGYGRGIFTIGRGHAELTHINIRPRAEWENLLSPIDYSLQKTLSNSLKEKRLVDMVWDRVYVMELSK